MRPINKILLKTILHRIGAIILSFAITYILLGDIKRATLFTVIYETLHSCWYASFEALWKKYKHKIYK